MNHNRLRSFRLPGSPAVRTREETNRFGFEHVVRPWKHGVIHQDEESAAGPTAPVTNALELFTAAFRQDGRFLSRSFIYEENSAWNGIITPPVNQLSRLSHGVQAHQCLEDKRYTFDYPWARHDLKRKEERGKIKELP